jgi:hypothetical protein
MTFLMNLTLVVVAMLTPYLVAAGLTAAFPSLRRGFGLPRTDVVVARFFDGTRYGDDRSRPPHEMGTVRS